MQDKDELVICQFSERHATTEEHSPSLKQTRVVTDDGSRFILIDGRDCLELSELPNA